MFVYKISLTVVHTFRRLTEESNDDNSSLTNACRNHPSSGNCLIFSASLRRTFKMFRLKKEENKKFKFTVSFLLYQKVTEISTVASHN